MATASKNASQFLRSTQRAPAERVEGVLAAHPNVLEVAQENAQAAGVTGAVAAAVTLASLPVFWHGVVISALPADVVRAACGLALVGGASAAALSLLPEFDA